MSRLRKVLSELISFGRGPVCFNLLRIAVFTTSLLVSLAHLTIPSSSEEYSWKPSKLKWSVSCGADKGSIRKVDGGYVMRTSKNYCKGGIFNQRAEINTQEFSVRRAAAFSIESDISFTGESNQDFIFLQIHDGRNGCSPPLSVRWSSNGLLSLDSDYTKGKGMKGCVENEELRDADYFGPYLSRDGAVYKFKALFEFDGSGGFDVQILVNGKEAMKGRYDPPKEREFVRSRKFFFKHGVYSENVWKYAFRSQNLRVLEATDPK